MLAAGAGVCAFDRDPDAIAAAQSHPQLRLFEACFSEMASVLEEADLTPVDGVTLDIGVSSMQLDQAERGFSFQSDGPLDMRMAQAGETAAEFLNSAPEDTIADVIYRYGDEPKSRRIARAIVAARPLARTGDLANVVRRACGYKPHDKKDPATRTFQAIRIHINGELDELEGGLAAAERILKPGGRLAVVTFHSLEDRMVKQFLRARSGSAPAVSRHAPDQIARGPAASFESVAKPVRAGEDEVSRNPRARSATLRVARRTAAPAWSSRKGDVS
jgi:16S rRNA (cytosine1402-N4)-methyltransferase